MTDKIHIQPQEGKQTDFLSSKADIVIFGGSAGGGKSYGLLLEVLRHIENKLFKALIFRRTFPMIKNQGGLWDTSQELYRSMGGIPIEHGLKWTFPSGAALKFAHMEHEKSKYNYQGAQTAFIGFDELTQFTESQFFYLISRLRSMSGISGYVRATCNPDSESWVAKFIEWWIDDITGLAIPERCGVIRWFIRDQDKIIWSSNKKDLIKKYGKDQIPKSVTFINARIYDNKILMEKDPTYLSNLMALPLVEREQLLHGNWKIKPSAGLYFKKEYFEVLDVAPYMQETIRFWDRGASEKTPTNDPSWTVGLKLGKDKDGIFYIMDVVRFQASPHKVEQRMLNIAAFDGKKTIVGMFQDPGGAGKSEVEYMTRRLVGYATHINKISKDKITAAKPSSSQAEVGNIKIIKGHWNDDFFTELENFPPESSGHEDQVDALSGAIEYYYARASGVWGQQTKDLVKRKNYGSVEKRIKPTQY